MIPQKCPALQKLGGNGRAVIIYFGGSIQSSCWQIVVLFLHDHWGSLTAEIHGVIHSFNWVSKLVDSLTFSLVANVTCPWQISANFRLLSLKKIGWHRIRVHSPHGVLFPYKKESNPDCPVLVINNPRRLNGVVDLRLGRVVERHCSRGALQICNE